MSRLAEQADESLAAEWNDLVTDLEFKEIGEGLMAKEEDADAGHETE